jgi:hypothetical protein
LNAAHVHSSSFTIHRLQLLTTIRPNLDTLPFDIVFR